MSHSSNTRSVAGRPWWLIAVAFWCCGSLMAPGYGQDLLTAPNVPTDLPLDTAGPVAELLDVTCRLTVPGIGAGQGVMRLGGQVYLYGDAETGVIREFEWSVERPCELPATGRAIQLTRHGEDVVPHPTGLTQHPELGTFLGDTVLQKGTIFQIDWERALAEGNLDHAILNMVNDDLATNGTRPEFVQIGGRWLIATSDYGNEQNQLRLYDPQRLQVVARTSAPGVLVRSQPCGTFVQSMEWVPEWNALVLVQNQIAGLRYRLTLARWSDKQAVVFGGEFPLARFSGPFDLEQPRDELEGWTYLGEGWCLYLSSSRTNNVSIGKVRLRSAN